MKTIIVTRRQDDYHACLKEDAAIWACGKTENEAIGNLIRFHPQKFDIIIEAK